MEKNIYFNIEKSYRSFVSSKKFSHKNTDMQKIIVTGCAGFIGSHLTEKLLEKGHQVIGIDNFDPFYDRETKENNLKALLNKPGFYFFEFDLAEISQYPNFPFIPDVIVHLAGKAGVRPSIADPAGYIRANIAATQNILDFMKEHEVSKMVFASSSSVYGNHPDTPYSESMNVDHPISPYAFTKKGCELLNYNYHHLYNFDIINLRFFTVYGPRQRPDLAIHKFAKLLLENKSIPMFGDGSTARDYTFVTDTLDGIINSIEYVLNHNKVYEIINLGNDHPVSLKDMIQTISETLGITPRIDQLPMQPGDVLITHADISRAKKLLNYQPKVPFNEGIKKFVAWIKNPEAG